MSHGALDSAKFPASSEAESRHGDDLAACFDRSLIGELDWDLIISTLHERGFVEPGPVVAGISYWLLTDHGSKHIRVGVRTVVQMLCGRWADLAFNRILEGVTGRQCLMQIYRITRPIVRIRRRHDAADEADRQPTGAAALNVRFRRGYVPCVWWSRDGMWPLLPGFRIKRRLVAGRPLRGWRVPSDRLFHGEQRR